jgi:hypothetical protein
MAIYSGILKDPIEVYKLPDNFKMLEWIFFKCSSDVFKSALSKHISKKVDSACISICYADAISMREREILVGKLPMTSRFWRFDGMYLNLKFNELSPDYVFRPLVHTCPVYDAMTAIPSLKQLFLFQITLLDPRQHPIKISSFNEVISRLIFDEPDSIDEIYFFMIISAHDTIKSQHFFSFDLGVFKFNACYLQEYSSAAGLSALRKVVKMDVTLKRHGKFMLENELTKSLSAEELAILRTIGGFEVDDTFHGLILNSALYEDLFSFLGFASKIKPYICRAPYLTIEVRAN